MGKVIEVYVKNAYTPVGVEQGYYLISPGHECTRTPATFAKFGSVLPEADKQALDLSQAIAEEKRLELKVHNISTLRGKLMAQLKGVRKTPIVIIGNNRIEDSITKDKIISLL